MLKVLINGWVKTGFMVVGFSGLLTTQDSTVRYTLGFPRQSTLETMVQIINRTGFLLRIAGMCNDSVGFTLEGLVNTSVRVDKQWLICIYVVFSVAI